MRWSPCGCFSDETSKPVVGDGGLVCYAYPLFGPFIQNSLPCCMGLTPQQGVEVKTAPPVPRLMCGPLG